MIKLYEPKWHHFYDIHKSNENTQTSEKSYKSRNIKLLLSLKQIKESSISYDQIICTRFDPIFKKLVTDYKIDFNKLNFHFKQRKEIDDNLFIFPIKYLCFMIDFLEQNIDSRGHDFYEMMIKKNLIDRDKINFLCELHERNQFFSLPYYKLKN